MIKKFLIDYPIAAALEAGKAILNIYNSTNDIEVVHKADDSPLTKADQAANDVINRYLTQTEYPIISEENKQIPYEVRKNWDSCWIVDPLDGTKEFIKKNGEFTVNIAFCKNGKPTFGVIYVPVSRELYYGDVDSGMAFKTMVSSEHTLVTPLFMSSDRLQPANSPSTSLKLVGSRSHMNPETEAFINKMQNQFEKIEIVSKGSSLKFCMVAEGKAHMYPRFAPTMEWDTAAGSAIVEALGLKVTTGNTEEPLVYNKENLLNPYFLVSM
ncbi:3'(2'),5'-bisphosphate nucleotidase CysQ [Robiginitalea aurantiaca]|uniref:3'(2'),5'-bisphosphate nucleotidase CysQ n=1 Tax=Robiginitalea aurantiaca TaxID=3056915 RepID=A0ABT7WI20_9FLAO|nr:3'(2'),5'-bisphosphate nucleotidase CysQ [Robiginitalea aurantiaca]MDM9632569.1 3'(2'),5'-bisphosphate nucleotidase CysQ [Robiginitalea aurantiaca]